MSNVVQNINIEDIVSSNFKINEEEKYKIEKLSQLVKNFGILDPLLVRPKNGKYEIVLGIENYQAAKLAGLNSVPVMIKDIDDVTYSKYLDLDNRRPIQDTVSQQEIPPISEKNDLYFPNSLESINNDNYLESTSRLINRFNDNSDIVNLSELSKIKLEYERDDRKMNNGQLNNMMNNNIGQPQINQTQSQGPTFGGRFFPSLEDEPTNMNMNNRIIQPSVAPTPPIVNDNVTNNNNLIDLTDLSIDKEAMPVANNNFINSQPSQSTPEINTTFQNSQETPTNFGISTPEPSPIASPTDNIINLGNLQSNNPSTQTLEPEPVSMETLNADFGSPMTRIQQPQFDMSQNVAPQMTNIPSPEVTPQPMNMLQNDFSIPNQSPIITQSEIQDQAPQPVNPRPTPESVNIPSFNTEINSNFELPSSMTTRVPSQVSEVKNLTPVTNTIKSLITNLEEFGYKIHIMEEDLPTVAKITIEVEK